MAIWYNASVVRIDDETPFVRRFYLAIEELEIVDFLPGQFITLDLPISEKRQHRWRSYSIANAPDGSNNIELCIVRKYDGLGSTYLFNEIKVGSKLQFKGPDGAFVLPKSIAEKKLVMICTGTGIAPFRSFIQHIDKHELPFKGMHLIFGARQQSDILYRNEMIAMAKKHTNFQYDIALSREDKNGDFHKGYVHDIYQQIYTNNIENNLFYLCGWTAMIDDAVANLIVGMACDRNQVVYELYG
jgi:ferredoxin-NADP reductase